MNDYPQSIIPVGHIEPVPRRIRGVLGGELVFDTVHAIYVWDWPHFPQYYIPLADVTPGVLVDNNREPALHEDPARRHGLRVGTVTRHECALVYPADDQHGRGGTVHFEWGALDAWFEEDEEVFKHPRSPYARADALRSVRNVRVELDGITLAQTSSPVMVFETGLPTRYYFGRTEVEFGYLTASETVSACPYKGKTSSYWNVSVNDTHHPDLAWAYDFPTRQLDPIAGLVAFLNEKVDIVLDGVRLPRPTTLFSDPPASTFPLTSAVVSNLKR